MSDPTYRVRRANVDDVAQLGPLLKATLLPAAELEKRFTEFQVVEDQEGKLVGALGMQIAGKHGNIHSESYTDFGLSDQLRPMLWERLQNVATNHGLVRLWTEETAPFWKQAGFRVGDEQSVKVFPSAFGSVDRPWLTLKLKEDVDNLVSLDKEFARFMEAEKARTEEMFAQAKMLKGIAWVVAIVFALFVLGASFYMFRQMRAGTTLQQSR
jgi:N-acetylglutamate synthase-like GNAT family acetyltransferase